MGWDGYGTKGYGGCGNSTVCIYMYLQLPFHSPLLVDVCDENSSENKIEEIVNELDPKDFIIPQGTCTVVYTVAIYCSYRNKKCIYVAALCVWSF